MSLLETVLVKMDLSEEPTEFAHQDAHPDRSGTEPTVSAKMVGLDTELVDNAPSEHSLTHSEHVASALIPTKSSYPTDLFASHAALILNLQLIWMAVSVTLAMLHQDKLASLTVDWMNNPTTKLEDVIVSSVSIELMENVSPDVQILMNNGMEMHVFANLDLDYSTKFVEFALMMLMLIKRGQHVNALLPTTSSTHLHSNVMPVQLTLEIMPMILLVSATKDSNRKVVSVHQFVRLVKSSIPKLTNATADSDLSDSAQFVLKDVD